MVRLVRRLERSDRVNLSWIANRKGKRSDCGEGKQWIGNLLVLTCGCGVPFDDPKRRAMSLNDSLSFHDAAAAPRRRGTLTKHRHRRSRNTFTVAFRDSFSWDPRGILVASSNRIMSSSNRSFFRSRDTDSGRYGVVGLLKLTHKILDALEIESEIVFSSKAYDISITDPRRRCFFYTGCSYNCSYYVFSAAFLRSRIIFTNYSLFKLKNKIARRNFKRSSVHVCTYNEVCNENIAQRKFANQWYQSVYSVIYRLPLSSQTKIDVFSESILQKSASMAICVLFGHWLVFLFATDISN